MRLRPTTGGAMLAGVLVLAAAATAFGSAARPTDPPPASAQTVPISASVRVCPTAPGQNQAKGASTVIAVGTLPEVALPAGAAPPAPGDGVRLNRLAGSTTVPTPLTAAGRSSLHREDQQGDHCSDGDSCAGRAPPEPPPRRSRTSPAERTAP